jgi:hypothetical protein
LHQPFAPVIRIETFSQSQTFIIHPAAKLPEREAVTLARFNRNRTFTDVHQGEQNEIIFGRYPRP